jgi:AraC family transcriptional regulator
LTRGFRAAALAASIKRVGRRQRTRPPVARSIATIKRILTFLDEHPDGVPALGQLAAMAAMSRSHFSRTFHAVAGISLRDYARDLRLRRAHDLLVGSKLSLTAVAVESGFYDLPHLDKAFRQHLGMSPKTFRSRNAVV